MFPGTSDILIAIAAVSAMFVALFVGTAPTEAATFSIIAQGHSMTLNGPIEIGDAARLDQAYRQSCNRRGFCPERLFLDSDGGRAGESLRIADVIVHYAMHTVVARTAGCFSSCFNIFAAGPLRVVFPGSTIGVHSLSDESGAENSDTLAWTREMVGILRDRFSVPPAVIAKLLATPPSGMAYLTADDVNGWVQWLD